MDSTGTQPQLEIAAPDQSIERAQRQRWLELGLVILLLIVPSILSASYALFHPVTDTRSNFQLVGGLVRQVAGVLLVIYVLSRRGLGLKSIGLNSFRWTDLLKGVGLAFLAFIVTIINSVLVRAFSALLTGHAADMRDPRTIFGGISLIMFLIYSVSSAVFEETVVRGYVTTELIGLGRPIAQATLASIILQTSYHVYYGLGGALAVSGNFIVFALYFAKSRKLLPAILGHMFVDFAAVLINHFG